MPRKEQPKVGVTVADIARMAGVSRQRAHDLVKRPDFPPPLPIQLTRGQLWDQDVVRAWIDEWRKHWPPRD